MKKPTALGISRCGWSNADPLYLDYHDREWGVPVHDDRMQFEFLVLESAQAGLSWMTVLRKRPSYRRAFDDFDPEKVARYGERKIEALCIDAGIIRNRKKIEAAIQNAQAFLAIQEAFESFDAYIWRFVDGKPKQNAWRTRAAGPEPRIPGAEPRSQTARFPIRRPDHLLCPHASDRAGERPHRGLLPVSRVGGARAIVTGMV